MKTENTTTLTEHEKIPANSIPRFSIVKLNDKEYVLENKFNKNWANLIYDEDGVRKGKQISITQPLEVVSYPAQSAFELQELKAINDSLLNALKDIFQYDQENTWVGRTALKAIKSVEP